MDPPADAAVQDDVPSLSGGVRPLLRGSSILLVGRFISKLANFGTQVLIVRYLSQSAYGAFAYGLTVAALAQTFVSLGLDRAVVRFLPIFHERGETRKLFGTIAMAVVTILSIGLASILLVYGFQGQIGRSVREPETLALLLVLIFLAPVQALDDLVVGVFAVFAKPQAIFLRRHILAPGLKLAVVIALILSGSDVLFLAVGYLVSSLLGLGIYGYLLFRVFRDQGLLGRGWLRGLVMPWREVLGFSLPLLTSDFVYATITTVNVLLLEHTRGTPSVASYRAVQSAAQLNEFVMVSFATLFTPIAARMFAKDDRAGINDLYWQSAIWIATLSFPIFAVTFSLAQPITVLLYGSRYEASAPILALLALGYYFNAALGFNGLTLKVFGKVRYLVFLNVVTAALSIAVSLAVVPRLGALGAGIGTLVALVVHNVLKQLGLRLGTGIRLFEWRYLRVYAMIALCTAGLLAFQLTTSASVYVSLGLAALAALLVLRVNGRMLDVSQIFPEVSRIPGLRTVLLGR